MTDDDKPVVRKATELAKDPDARKRLLGRKPNVPDDRDWTPEKLHEHLPTPPDALLDETVRQAIADSPFFQTWPGIRALWAWIKHLLHPGPGPEPPPGPAPTPVEWPDSVVLDQGDYGTCVGNGGAGWLASEPVVDPGVDETLARKLYYESTCIDGQCDDPDAPGGGQNGSSVRSLAKALKNRGRLSAYAFATKMADVTEWLDNHGPVVIGIDWTSDMFNPDSTGLIKATGPVEGGHCVLLRYRVPHSTRVRGRNSWGTGWGQGGDFEIEAVDLAKLMTGLSGYPGDFLLAAEVPL